MDNPTTLQEAVVYFADKNQSHQFLISMRWPLLKKLLTQKKTKPEKTSKNDKPAKVS